MMDNWPAMKKWKFELLQDDPRLQDGVYIGQRQELVSLRAYNKYVDERAPNDSAPWMIFMPDVFEVYPRLRDVSVHKIHLTSPSQLNVTSYARTSFAILKIPYSDLSNFTITLCSKSH